MSTLTNILAPILLPIEECPKLTYEREATVADLEQLILDGAINIAEYHLFVLYVHQPDRKFHRFVEAIVKVCILNLNKHYGTSKQDRS